jgi:phosphoesterase RecJ-like protein
MMLKNSDFQLIREKLLIPSKIVLTTHTNPDGDAIGSCLAMFFYLQKKRHTVRIVIPDPFPEFLAWLPGQETIHIFEKEREPCLEWIDQADFIFSLDYNNLGRLNEIGEHVIASPAVKILLDHHLYPSQQFDLKISIPDTSSTSELVYDFIIESGDGQMLDTNIAQCIYTGIITDTGSFSYSCNYTKTYEIIAELIRLGIDGEHIHRLVYDTYSESRLRLLGHCISEKLFVLPEYHTAYIVLTKAELEKFRYKVGDTEGVVNYALSIKDINLAALFMERSGIVKVSFRSKGNFSVDTFARDHFNGGGHSNASGANCETPLEETVSKFLELLPSYHHLLRKVY